MFAVSANAQSFSVSGIVVDKNDRPVSGVTVFLGGTQKLIVADANGNFRFDDLTAGTFQLVAKMIGFAPYSQNIIVQHDIAQFKITLTELPVDLSQVVIKAKDPNRADKLRLFKENFLGLSKNGRNCEIVNPAVLILNWDSKGSLKGKTNDFLIIDNYQLGYRIRYLLKAFEFRPRIGLANYDGEIHFEEMSGTQDQQKEWAKNRLKTYEGSLMHFLRAVYSGKRGPVHEGFSVREVLRLPNDLELIGLNMRMRLPVIAEARQIAFDTIVSVVDTALISMKFRSGLLITYTPRKKLIKKSETVRKDGVVAIKLGNESSVLQLALKEAVIDSRGSFTNYRAFLMRGHWGEMRVGDQLPFEYEP